MPEKRKKFNNKIVFPLIVFLVGWAILNVIVHFSVANNRERLVSKAELTASTYATRMNAQIGHGTEATNTLKQLIVVGDGNLSSDDFDTVAGNLMNDRFLSLMLAPDGVVSLVYPANEENTSADLINDQLLGALARHGRDENLVTIEGPFVRSDDRTAISVRNPVYIANGSGESVFWGFTIAEMPVPEIFANSTEPLINFGYDYSLSRIDDADDEAAVVVCSSGNEMKNPISESFDLGCCTWTLSVAPADGWNSGSRAAIIAVSGIALVILLTVLAVFIVVFNQGRMKYKNMATIDHLTGLRNRAGFNEDFGKYVAAHPDERCVGALLDVDDFKFVNDLHGHDVGDEALKALGKSLVSFFPASSITARSGGDEFMLVLKNTTADEAEKIIKEFVDAPHSFTYRGTEYAFGISMGYAEYPTDAKTQSELLAKADIALYEAKLHGKRNCFAFDPNFRFERRSKLGFALSDVSKNLPGAFLIYKADPADDTLLYANSELVRLVGCRDLDDFMKFTKRKFGSLIRPDERDFVESSIWDQINSKRDGSNDYVKFHLATKNGEYKPILDHGRIVNSEYFGRVFYVLFIDSGFLAEHYADEDGVIKTE